MVAQQPLRYSEARNGVVLAELIVNLSRQDSAVDSHSGTSATCLWQYSLQQSMTQRVVAQQSQPLQHSASYCPICRIQ